MHHAVYSLKALLIPTILGQLLPNLFKLFEFFRQLREGRLKPLYGFLSLQETFRVVLPKAAVGRVLPHSVIEEAVWLDRENLFAIVEQNEQKSQQTIDEICTQLDPLGDTLGVVVNLQSGAATSGDELEILSRNCQLEPGDRAYLQQTRQVDVLSPAIRAQHKANQARPPT